MTRRDDEAVFAFLEQQADREPARCCARCRRGMPGMTGPCGLDLDCACHNPRGRTR